MAAPTNSLPAQFYVPITPGASLLADGACRSILVEVAGVLNLTQPDGTVRSNVPLSAGINPLCAIRINAPTSGTAATGVWALY